MGGGGPHDGTGARGRPGADPAALARRLLTEPARMTDPARRAALDALRARDRDPARAADWGAPVDPTNPAGFEPDMVVTTGAEADADLAPEVRAELRRLTPAWQVAQLRGGSIALGLIARRFAAEAPEAWMRPFALEAAADAEAAREACERMTLRMGVSYRLVAPMAAVFEAALVAATPSLRLALAEGVGRAAVTANAAMLGLLAGDPVMRDFARFVREMHWPHMLAARDTLRALLAVRPLGPQDEAALVAALDAALVDTPLQAEVTGPGVISGERRRALQDRSDLVAFYRAMVLRRTAPFLRDAGAWSEALAARSEALGPDDVAEGDLDALAAAERA